MYELGVVLERQAKDEGVEIRLNTTVTPEYVAQEGVDALILAVGSTPLVPPIPGIDGDNVIIVNEYYLNKDKVADSVVVLGGGLAGCECAIHLGMEGKKVELVEMRDTLAVDCNIRQRPILMRKVAEFSTTHTEYVGQKITADGVICKDKDGNEVLVPGKTVICALGQRANRADVDALRGCAPFVREVGDCVRPANITKAIYEAYHAALDI
jgi:pyruvate/2-oxoglutarate dehydrogenase complex dihydrolipoamide dehydrogenase (E3) component